MCGGGRQWKKGGAVNFFAALDDTAPSWEAAAPRSACRSARRISATVHDPRAADLSVDRRTPEALIVGDQAILIGRVRAGKAGLDAPGRVPSHRELVAAALRRVGLWHS